MLASISRTLLPFLASATPSAEIRRYNDDNYVNNQPSSMKQAAAVDKIVVGSYIHISILFFLTLNLTKSIVLVIR